MNEEYHSALMSLATEAHKAMVHSMSYGRSTVWSNVSPVLLYCAAGAPPQPPHLDGGGMNVSGIVTLMEEDDPTDMFDGPIPSFREAQQWSRYMVSKLPCAFRCPPWISIVWATWSGKSLLRTFPCPPCISTVWAST